MNEEPDILSNTQIIPDNTTSHWQNRSLIANVVLALIASVRMCVLVCGEQKKKGAERVSVLKLWRCTMTPHGCLNRTKNVADAF